MKAIFIIRGPLHAINVTEAVKCFGIRQAICILYLSHKPVGQKHDEQCSAILAPVGNLSLIKIHTHESATLAQRIGWYGEHINALKTFDADLVFFSDIRVQWQKDLVTTLNKKTYLMDEGAFSIIAHNLLATRKRFFHLPAGGTSARRTLALEIKAQYGIVEQDDYPYHFFTFLKDLAPIDGVDIAENPLSDTRRQWPALDPSRHVIVGSNFCNTFNLAEQHYCDLVAQLVLADKQNIYIPHPGVSDSTIELLQQQLPALMITRLQQPIEQWLAGAALPPADISSFYSAALCTIDACMPQLTLRCYKLPEQVVEMINQRPVWGIDNIEFKQTIPWIYDYLARHNAVIEID